MSNDTLMRTHPLHRAQGCLLGQLAGDALGSLVEFQTPAEIRRKFPDGVRELIDGGAWGTIAGQPTDDSEMALTLARLLAARGVSAHALPQQQVRHVHARLQRAVGRWSIEVAVIG